MPEKIKFHDVIEMALEDIRVDPNNPNVMTDKDMQALKYNFRKHGFGDTLKVDANGILIDGEHRLTVLKDLGQKSVKVHKFTNARTVEDRDVLRQMFKYNTGKHDHKLENEAFKRIFDAGRMEELSDTTGNSQDQYSAILEEAFNIPRPGSEIPDEPMARAKEGEIYCCGKHLVMCGDSTNPGDIQSLISMKEEMPRLLFTDPPYDFAQYGWLEPLILAERLPDLEILILNSDKPTVKMVKKYDYGFVGFYVITFNSPSRYANQPMISHRLISHYRKGKSNFQNLHDAFGTVHELALSKSGLTRHEKPLDLPRKFIIHYTKPGDIVLDLFGGSGSTMIACEQTGRVCYSLEKDPHKVDIMLKRYEDYSHEKATLA